MYVVSGVSLTSCSDDDDDEVTTGVFILNQGKSGNNNAGISVYNPETHAVTADVYMAQNDKGLGDTGLDMIQYGKLRLCDGLRFQPFGETG